MIDSSTLYYLSGKFIIGGLLLIRILGLMAAGPFFKTKAIDSKIRVVLALILAMSLTSAFWQDQPQIDFHVWNIAFLVFKEFFVGVAIGFAANVVFYGARFAGGMVDFNMGYQTASLFSAEETSPTLVGEFYHLMTLMLFLFMNGHHFLLESVYLSVRAVPISVFEVTESTLDMLMRIGVTVFIIGIKIAAPILIAIFLTNLSLALLSRIAPQTNIFILSFQMKISVGLLVLFISVPLFIMMAKVALQDMESITLDFLMTLNPARV